MKKFRTLKQGIEWIETRIKFKPKTDLSKMHEAILMLGTKNDFLRIHVAGTNGKGSTTSFVSNILMCSGYKVGTFLSPYLVKFNERIRINMVEIGDDDLLRLINFIFEFNEQFTIKNGESLSFFELLTLLALKHFNEVGCNAVVMEVGLGGLLDSTNALTYDLSLITNIGFDHMKQLGDTLESIAYNKLGILKKDGILVSTVDERLLPQFIKFAKEKHAKFIHISANDISIISHNPLKFKYMYLVFEPKLLGDYQSSNASLAIKGIKELGLDISDRQIIDGINQTTNPGRLEILSLRPLVIIDGAHNIHGIDALVSAIKTMSTGNIWVIFSSLKDKNPVQMLNRLDTISDNIILTTFDDPRVLSVTDVLMEKNNVLFIKDYKTAYKYVKKNMSENDTILITGSIHFIGYVKKVLKK